VETDFGVLKWEKSRKAARMLTPLAVEVRCRNEQGLGDHLLFSFWDVPPHTLHFAFICPRRKYYPEFRTLYKTPERHTFLIWLTPLPIEF